MNSTSRKCRARIAQMSLAVLATVSSAALAANPNAPAGALVTVNNQFFDYNVPPAVAPVQYVPSPFLTDANAATVNSFLLTQPVRAVKVDSAISNATANLIFNNPNYQVSYVLGDLEGANAQALATQLAGQVRYLNGAGGAKTNSFNAYVGNFGFTPVPMDPTRPANYSSQLGSHSFSGFSSNAYQQSGLNMVNEDLYPGSPSFRSPAAGNSSAPNLRSALFTLPVLRASYVTQNLAKGDAHVPWITNFNNWGNTALHTPSAPDNTNGHQFFFANPSGDQMLSRRDFATLVAHYRLRGADSFALLNSGNTAVTDAQLRDDAIAGWTESTINAILSAADGETLLEDKKLSYPIGGPYGAMTKIISDGQVLDVEDAGAILSGAYSLDEEKLAILISNMDQGSHTITVPEQVAGYALSVKEFTLSGGTHLLAEYSLTGQGKKKGWEIASQHVPFTAISNSRNGFGIPEPGTLSMLAVGAILGLNRRSRGDKAKA